MSSAVLTRAYSEMPFDEKEILRYAACPHADGEVLSLLRSCKDELSGKLTYKVCYRELPVHVDGDICDFSVLKVRSKNLAKNLSDCKHVVLFAASIGIEIDRFITKYSRISPSRALMLQAMGAQRIEALCDAFCADISRETGLSPRPRFSPGYGDLALSVQRDIFTLLDCERKIGLFLNDSLLMSPTKSVTAFLGLTDK